MIINFRNYDIHLHKTHISQVCQAEISKIHSSKIKNKDKPHLLHVNDEWNLEKWRNIIFVEERVIEKAFCVKITSITSQNNNYDH